MSTGVVPRIGADDDHVNDAPRTPVLKRVIEHGDVAAKVASLCAAGDAVGRHDYRDIGIERAVHKRLVVSVAAENDRWTCTHLLHPSSDVCRERRLAGSAVR
jgi:hypothetical protein